jgi:hypothetical protein
MRLETSTITDFADSKVVLWAKTHKRLELTIK